MTLKDHIDIINNSVVMEVKEGNSVLYHGYKACLEYEKNAKELEQKEITKFCLRVDGKRRTNEKDRATITELNSGIFNYGDMHIELVYVYETI